MSGLSSINSFLYKTVVPPTCSFVVSLFQICICVSLSFFSTFLSLDSFSAFYRTCV